MTTEDKDLILGALDSLGVALADHDHEWTEGERCIYEAAVECVKKVERARVPVACSGWLAAGNKLSAAVDGIRFMLYGLALDARQAVIAQKAIDEAVDAVRQWREKASNNQAQVSR